MKKKTSIFAISLAIILSLTACSFTTTGNGSKKSKSSSSSSVSSSQVVDERDQRIVEIYNLYVAAGGTLTYEEWLTSIKGEKGEPGAQGQPGAQGEPGAKGDPGQNGKSAYEIYIAAHPEYTGNEDQWIDDLVNGRLGTKVTHTVSFNSNNGSAVAPQTVLHGEKASKPADPTRSGYTFDGWYYQGEQWSFIGYVVTENMTLVAHWLDEHGGVAPEEEFTILTDLAETKEIHTAAQKAYLSYEGQYVSIPTDLYPDGNQHLSDPLPVNLQWNFTPASGKTVDHYSVVFGKEADLSDGYQVVGTSVRSFDLYNVYLGRNYFKLIAHYTDSTNYESEIKSFMVDETAPRNLKIGGMTNCRDMGGRTLEDGGKIKQGLIYRTSGTNGWGGVGADGASNITSAGVEELINHLGVKTEINVHNSSNNNYAGVDNFVAANMWYDGGKHHLYRNAEPLKKVFATLADENNYPLFYHCRIGTDRTGLVAIMISGLLGLPENEIYKDYLFSNFGNIQDKRYIGDAAGRDNILNYINDIKAMPGEKFSNKIYNYLMAIGIPRAQLDSVINILTEGNKVTGNGSDKLFVGPNDFEVVDATRNTSSTLANPSVFYNLGASQSVIAPITVNTAASNVSLFAYLGSATTSESSYVNESIEVKVDGDTLTQNVHSFYDAGFGTGDSRTYYSAVNLGTIANLSVGNHRITITGVANNLNIAGISFIGLNGEIQEPCVHNFIADGSKVDIPAGCETTGSHFEVCTECGFERVVTVPALGHDWVNDPDHDDVPAGCNTPGTHYEKCATCGEERGVPVEKLGHDWQDSEEVTPGNGCVKYVPSVCSRDGAYKYTFSALDDNKVFNVNPSNGDKISSIKSDTASGYFKLNKNGDSVTYTLNYPGPTSTAMFYQIGFMDYWSSNTGVKYGAYNTNANTTARASGNFDFTVNETLVDKSAYMEMTLTELTKDGQNSSSVGSNYSPIALIPIGQATINNGTNTITYARTGSYNFVISHIVIIVEP